MFPGNKKNKKPKNQERTYRSVRSGTVRSASPVLPGSVSKKKERNVDYVPQEQKQQEVERTYLSSFRDRSFDFAVRPGSVSKKVRKGTLITFP